MLSSANHDDGRQFFFFFPFTNGCNTPNLLQSNKKIHEQATLLTSINRTLIIEYFKYSNAVAFILKADNSCIRNSRLFV